MNRNQWFVFAGVLFLMAMFFLVDAILQANNANFAFIGYPNITVVESNVYNALTVRSAIYGSVGTVCLGLFLICLICGYLEKKK